MDSCALILLEPRLLRPKYMQRGDSAPPKPVLGCTPSRQEGPFFAVTALKSSLFCVMPLIKHTELNTASLMDFLGKNDVRFTLEGPQDETRLLWGRQ